MSENKCFPVSLCTGDFDLKFRGMTVEQRSVASAVCSAPPAPPHTPVSTTTGLPLPRQLCIWSWLLYLPYKGPSCISAIWEIDCTSHTSPSRLPYLHVLVHTSSAGRLFFSSRQPFKPTSGVCSVPLLHQHPSWIPPLQAKQKTACYAGVTMLFGVGVESWLCHLLTGGSCSVIEPPCLRVSIIQFPPRENTVRNKCGSRCEGPRSERELKECECSLSFHPLKCSHSVSAGLSWQLSLVLFYRVLEHLRICFISLFV